MLFKGRKNSVAEIPLFEKNVSAREEQQSLMLEHRDKKPHKVAKKLHCLNISSAPNYIEWQIMNNFKYFERF